MGAWADDARGGGGRGGGAAKRANKFVGTRRYRMIDEEIPQRPRKRKQSVGIDRRRRPIVGPKVAKHGLLLSPLRRQFTRQLYEWPVLPIFKSRTKLN